MGEKLCSVGECMKMRLRVGESRAPLGRMVEDGEVCSDQAGLHWSLVKGGQVAVVSVSRKK